MAAPTPAGVRSEPADRPDSRICLVVDDSRVIRKISRRIVERVGYEVLEAENGAEALARCKVDMPDLVILDWDMPVMTGIEFVSQLREFDPSRHAKVVFCTSHSSDIDKQEACEAGADEFVTKPFDQAALEGKLHKIGAI